MNITGWTILAVLAVIAITVFYRKGLVWAGLTTGIVVGIIIGVVYLVQGNKFAWDGELKASIVGTLIGAILQWISEWVRQRRQ